jgi:hypothetical protein
MRRFTALAAAVLVLALPAAASAKGGYVRLPEPKVVRAGVPVPEFDVSPGQILGGCGAKRYRDSVTHRCRGPADIGR